MLRQFWVRLSRTTWNGLQQTIIWVDSAETYDYKSGYKLPIKDG